jgi:dolichol-phosphate mannosyltransferase
MSTIRILVALATFNEIESLPALVDEILRVLPDADLLVVDDNSPDGTGRWCDQRAGSESRLSCIHRSGKLGLGTATLEAVRYALARDYDIFVTLDADGSHDPDCLPTLIDATRQVDVAIGSRYCPGGATAGWPLYRRVLSRALNRLNRAALRLPVRDSSGSYRAYHTRRLRELPLESIRAGGYGYLEEILWHLQRAGASFAEVPITFRQRRGGRSKMSLREAADKLGMLFRLAPRRRLG